MNSVKRHWSSFQRNWHRVLRFAAHRSGCAKDVKVHPVPLLGGLESAGVLKLEITWTSRRGKPCSDCFVLKRLVGSWTRELPIYEALADTPAADAIPRLLGAEVLDPTEVYMYLELLSTQNLWPWKHKEKSVAVLHQLAKVHAVSCPGLRAIQDWDYETDIQYAAESTVKSFVSLVHLGMATGGRPMLRPLERIVTTLPAMRTALNSWQKPVLLHGDMHTGNVAWRIEKGAGHTAVLLDWGERVRVLPWKMSAHGSSRSGIGSRKLSAATIRCSGAISFHVKCRTTLARNSVKCIGWPPSAMAWPARSNITSRH